MQDTRVSFKDKILARLPSHVCFDYMKVSEALEVLERAPSGGRRPQPSRPGKVFTPKPIHHILAGKKLTGTAKDLTLLRTELRKILAEDRKAWEDLYKLGQEGLSRIIEQRIDPIKRPHVASVVWFDLFSWEYNWREEYAEAYKFSQYRPANGLSHSKLACALLMAIENNPLEKMAKPLSLCTDVRQSPHYVEDEVEMALLLCLVGYTPFRAVGRIFGEAHSMPSFIRSKLKKAEQSARLTNEEL